MKKYLAWIFCRLGFTADSLTFLGLGFALLSGVLVYYNRFGWAAAALLFSGFLDLMDGAVARLSGSSGKFGGILDSFLDRYGDAFVLGGILFYCVYHMKFVYALLAFSALVGSFAISYVRARAECEMPACRVGFWERGERVVFIALGLLFNNLPVLLGVLAVGTHWTAFRRLRCAAKGGVAPVFSRQSTAYFIQVGILIGLVVFFQIRF